MMIRFKQSNKRNAVYAFALKEVLLALAILAMMAAGILMVTFGLKHGHGQAKSLEKSGSITLAAREHAPQATKQTRATQDGPSQPVPMTNGPAAGDEHSPTASVSRNNAMLAAREDAPQSAKQTRAAQEAPSQPRPLTNGPVAGNEHSPTASVSRNSASANAASTQPFKSQTVGFHGSAQEYSKTASTPGAATVVRISGAARYSLGDGNWHPLVVGKTLAAGSIIQAGSGAMVDIVLGKRQMMPQADPVPDRISEAADPNVRGLVTYKPFAEQNTIRMTGDTVLAIDKLTVSDTGLDSVSDTELDLRQGGIYSSVRKLSAASQYLIKIPNGIAGVRGTLFYLDATGRCSVYKSSAVLSIIGMDGRPETVVVGEGTGFDSQSGETRPLSPEFITNMSQIFKALRTMYYGIVNFTFDATSCRISPTAGRNTHQGGGGGGGP
jgi:hypothetical protein